MPWFVIHTKPRQENRALENLQQQGFSCFLPTWQKQVSSAKGLKTVQEPLFSRYLFIQLDTDPSGKSWAPIRSTRGVARLVAFGPQPAPVDPQLIEMLQQNQAGGQHIAPPPYQPGDTVRITRGAFAGLEAIYQMDDGEQRAMLLIELLHRPSKLSIAIHEIEPL